MTWEHVLEIWLIGLIPATIITGMLIDTTDKSWLIGALFFVAFWPFFGLIAVGAFIKGMFS